MSNWEKRPLRYSQEHYAALDAWVLVILLENLLKQGKKHGITLNDCLKSIPNNTSEKNPEEANGPVVMQKKQSVKEEIKKSEEPARNEK